MTDTKTASVLIIGNEILSGRTQDTNTSWIAMRLNDRGIRLAEVRVIPDIESRIIESIKELKEKVTYLFTTGGIGPTHDDITTDSIAKAFGVEVRMNDEARAALLAHYELEENLTPARLRMARIPEGASLIPNPVSGAPGYRIENVFVMAGVPLVMQAMFDHVLPELEGGAPILSNAVSCNLPESIIADALAAIQDKYIGRVEIGSYPHFRAGEMGLSVVLRSVENAALHDSTFDVINMIEICGGRAFSISLQSSGSE